MNNGVAIKKALARPDVRKKMREQANRAWADPELPQERILAMRRAGAGKRGGRRKRRRSDGVPDRFMCAL
jgi:hypothetical protein